MKQRPAFAPEAPASGPLKANPGTKRLQLGTLAKLGMPTSQQETWSHWNHTHSGAGYPLSQAQRCSVLAGQLPLEAGWLLEPAQAPPAGNFLAPFPPLSATLLEFPPDGRQPFLFSRFTQPIPLPGEDDLLFFMMTVTLQ